MYIRSGTEEEVYNNVKNVPIAEFEKTLRNEYKMFSLEQKKSIIEGNKDTLKYELGPLYIREDTRQTYPVQYNSSMYLDSTVFSATGNIGTYTYESIQDYGTIYPGNTGYHFEVDYAQSNYSVGSNKKYVYVHLTGIPVDPYGLALTIIIHANHTFYCN